MEELEEKRVCIVCSSFEDRDGGNEDGSGSFPTDSVEFSKFCGLLQKCGDKHQEFSAPDFLRGLDKRKDDFFLCSKCMQLITKAEGCKMKVEDLEWEVLKIQVQLLEKMKVLREASDLYFKEMEGILERVRSADLECVEGKVQPRNWMFLRGGKWQIYDVLLFREKIMDVVTYLGMFQEEMEKKLLFKNSNLDVIGTKEDMIKPQQNRPVSPVAPAKSMDLDEDNFQDLMDSFNDNDWEDDDVEVQDLDSVAIKTENIENETGVTKPKKIVEDPADLSVSEDEDKTEKKDDSEDEEYIPPKRIEKNVKKMRKRKPKGESQLKWYSIYTGTGDLDLSGMGPYKSQFIRRILNVNLVIDSDSKLNTGKEITVVERTRSLRQQYKWEYDQTSDKLTIADHPIILEETQEPEKSMTGVCCKCDYRYYYDFTDKTQEQVTRGIQTVENRIFNHVLSEKHLDAFKCLHCPHRSLSIDGCRNHLRKYHRAEYSAESEGTGNEGDDKDKQQAEHESEEDHEDNQNPSSSSKMEKGIDRYKQQFIRRVITITERLKAPPSSTYNPKTPSTSSVIIYNLRKTYKWSYDSSTDKLDLAGHQVLIQENPKPAKMLILTCTLCNYQYSQIFDKARDTSKIKLYDTLRTLERNMFDHIVGQLHIDAYTCEPCGSHYKGLTGYQNHLNRYHDDNHNEPKKRSYQNPKERKGLKPTPCEKCGRHFYTEESMEMHMITHLGGLERKQFLEKIRHKTPQPKMDLQCMTCGRTGFVSATRLRIHEATHKDMEERSMMICPFCGSKMLKKTYSKHYRDHCKGNRDKKEPLVCAHCGKECWGQKFLDDHIARKHTEYDKMPFECKDCGRGYKLLRDLTHHRLHTHDKEAREGVVCGKGCGKKLRYKVAMQKHEAKCKFGLEK